MSGRPPAAASAADRLSRLLALVPWLLEHQGVPLEDAARHFAITPDQLVRDLELLFVCGTPGHLPDDLIEADWEEGRVYLGNADAIARPLRLGLDEALALVAGLRTLLDVPGAGDREALTGALAKLSEAAGEAAAAARAVSVDLRGDDAGTGPDRAQRAEEVLATVRAALRGRRRLRVRYLVLSRDETTDRQVDPMRVLTVDGRWYLEGWDHRSSAVRLFRLDRVLHAELTGADGTPPPEALARDVDDGLFTPSPEDLLVTLDLAPSARWVVEQVPVEDSTEVGDGHLRVRLRTADPRWLRRLLLSLGGSAAVVDPPEVAALVADAAQRALDAYTGTGAGTGSGTGSGTGRSAPVER